VWIYKNFVKRVCVKFWARPHGQYVMQIFMSEIMCREFYSDEWKTERRLRHILSLY